MGWTPSAADAEAAAAVGVVVLERRAVKDDASRGVDPAGVTAIKEMIEERGRGRERRGGGVRPHLGSLAIWQ